MGDGAIAWLKRRGAEGSGAPQGEQNEMQPPTAASQPPALTSGVVLRNRYMIEGYIGGGGFAHIYRARDIALGHVRALKEAFARDPNTQKQFQLEAEFLLNVRHPNLVRGYSVFEASGRLYLVMDYVDGDTLEDIAIETIKRTHRPPVEAQVLDWILPICDAAHALHCQPAPIIHRDIKPANIKLSRSLGAPVLIDLGLAKLFAQGQQTIAAALAFTPGYAPPEQYQAVGATDQRTDVYGLGATLYYLLTGYQPVEAPARISAQALPTPRERNSVLSERTNAVVLQAMALDPYERFQSMKELEHELALCRAALGARPAGAVEKGAPRLCASCGAKSPAEARFCMRCGDALWAEPWQTAPVAAVAPRPTPAPRPYVPAALARPTQPPALLWPAADERTGAPAAALAAQPLRLGYPATWLAALDQAPPATPQEAQVALLAVVAAVCVALGLTAPFNPPMVVFALVGVGLSSWSLSNKEVSAAPREFRWLAIGALSLGVFWLLILLLYVALGPR